MKDKDPEYKSSPLKTRDLFKAQEAVDLLEALIGSSTETKRHLIDQVKSNRLALFARRRWDAKAKSPKNLRKLRPEAGVVERKKVGFKIISNTSDVVDLATNWNWKSGIFYLPRVTKRGEFSRHIVLEGVRFKKSEIHLMMDGLRFALKDKGERGRRTDDRRWGLFTFNLVEYGRTEEFTANLINYDAFRAGFRTFYTARTSAADVFSESRYDTRLRAVFGHALDAKREWGARAHSQ